MQLEMFKDTVRSSRIDHPVNVASVPQRSPFRYPGGKTWLVPVVRRWLRQEVNKPELLIEPFAGGGIVSLTAIFENLAETALMVEKDAEIAAVWDVIINRDYRSLAERILTFEMNTVNAMRELSRSTKAVEDTAFCTILKNRIFHGGILAKGSGLIKHGENGKGISSRWYPKTLRDRIEAIGQIRGRIRFVRGDAFETLDANREGTPAYYFIDPPYTAAGRRLYTHFAVDHEKLFDYVSRLKGRFMLTYDDADEIRALAGHFGLSYRTIPMKTTHHLKKQELIICDNFDWWD